MQQAAAPRGDEGNAGGFQFTLVQLQVRALPHQRHHVAGTRGARAFLVCHPPAAQHLVAQHPGKQPGFRVHGAVVGLRLRRRERVAQSVGRCGFRFFHLHRQTAQRAGAAFVCRRMRVLGKPVHLGEHRIDRLHDRRRQAPRHVGAETGGIKMRAQKLRRRAEHPRLAAAEAVDRLLRIAHHEYRHVAVRRARLGQPGRQRLPLQRVGVLEFVEQKMAVARVQLQRQRGGVLLAGEQAAGQPFGVGKVDHPLLRLDILVRAEQRVTEQQAMAIERPDALVSLDCGDAFERGLQRVEVAQVGVEFGAECFFQLLRRLFLAPLARGHQVFHQRGVRVVGRQAQAALDFRRARLFALAAFFQRKAHSLHPRRHQFVGPESRYRIAVQVRMQRRP